MKIITYAKIAHAKWPKCKFWFWEKWEKAVLPKKSKIFEICLRESKRSTFIHQIIFFSQCKNHMWILKVFLCFFLQPQWLITQIDPNFMSFTGTKNTKTVLVRIDALIKHNLWCSLRKVTRLPILENEIYPLFEDKVKYLNFRFSLILMERSVNFYMRCAAISIGHFVFTQKRPV